MIQNRKNYLTTFEAAAKLGFHPDYLRRLILGGKVRAEKLGRNWIISLADLARLKRQRFPRTEKKDNGSSK